MGLIYTPSNGRTIIPEAETGGCVVTGETALSEISMGRTKGRAVDGSGKLRAIYATELPTSITHVRAVLYTAAQARPTRENPYTITQPLVYMMRCISKYWTYGTLNCKQNVARGLVDDTTSVNWQTPGMCRRISHRRIYTGNCGKLTGIHR